MINIQLWKLFNTYFDIHQQHSSSIPLYTRHNIFLQRLADNYNLQTPCHIVHWPMPLHSYSLDSHHTDQIHMYWAKKLFQLISELWKSVWARSFILDVNVFQSVLSRENYPLEDYFCIFRAKNIFFCPNRYSFSISIFFCFYSWLN